MINKLKKENVCLHISFSLISKDKIINMCNKFGLEIKGQYSSYSLYKVK